MAVVSVSADNDRVAVATIATDTGTWGNDGGGGATADEPDLVYQGSTSQSRKISTARIGRSYDGGTTRDATAGLNRRHFLFKINVTNYSALEPRTTPSAGVKIGSASTAFHEFYLFGNDNYPIAGGWVFVPLSPSVAGYRDAVTGVPDLTAVDYYSLLADFSATAKSENVAIDAIDLGRGLKLTGGDGADTDGVFADFLNADEGTSANRWGYIRNQGGIYYVNGELAIGENTSESAVNTSFVDTTGQILVWENGYVETGYHRLKINLSATTNTSITATFISNGKKNNDANRSYSTLEDSRLIVEVVGTTGLFNAFTGCTFVNLQEVIGSSITNFNGCDIQTEKITGTSINVYGSGKVRTTSTAEVATWVDPTFGTSADLRDTEFVQEGTGHAIQLDAKLGTETATAYQASTAIAGNTGANTVAWPTHLADDVAFLYCETHAEDLPYLSTPAGFEFVTRVVTEDGTVSNPTALTIWWKRAASGAESSPVIADAGDHSIAGMDTFRGCITAGLPWSDFATSHSDTAGTTITVPAVTTSADGQLVYGIAGHGFSGTGAWASAQTNAGLTSITEQTDTQLATGNGGGLSTFTATDTTAGSTGTTSITNANSTTWTAAMFALRGTAATDARGAYQAAQTVQSGIGAVSVSWPTHQTDDVAFLIAETLGSENPTLSTPAGFTLVDTIASTTDTRCTIWWHRATSGSMTAPTIADAGDHVVATMVTFRGCRTSGNPWDAYTTAADNTSDTSSTFPAVTTIYDGQTVVGVMAQGSDNAGAWGSGRTNAGLTSITERFDDAAIDGNGGGLNVFTATDVTKGSTGTTSITLANASETAAFMFALAAKETSYTLTDLSFTGYGADGSNSSAIWIPDQGGQYKLNLSGGTTPTVTSAGAGWRTINTVTLTINVKDKTGANINNARVRIQETDGTLISDGTTTSGTYTDSTYNYVSDTAVEVLVRKSSSGDNPRYVPSVSNATITSTGLNITVTLIKDSVAT